MRTRIAQSWAVYEVTPAGERHRIGAWDVYSAAVLSAGRSRKSDIVFGRNDLGVSRHQLEIKRSRKCWNVKNTGTARIYRLRDEKYFEPEQIFQARAGDRFRISDTVLELVSELAAPTYHLEVTTYDKQVCQAQLKDDQVTIGSAPRPINDVVVSVEGVSRQHIQLNPVGEGRFIVEDLQSKNGVYTQKKGADRSERIEKAELSVGDTFSFGEAVGAICLGPPTQKKNSLRYILCALLCLIAFGILYLGGDREPPPPPLSIGMFRELWGENAHSKKALYKAISVHLDAAGNEEFPGRAAIVEIYNALGIGIELTESSSRMERERQLIMNELNQNPWAIRQIRNAFREDPERLKEKVLIYTELKDKQTRWADELELSEKDIQLPFDADMPERWDQDVKRHNEFQDSVKKCQTILNQWENREWFPPPTAKEREDWVSYAKQIGDDFVNTTQADIDTYSRAIENISNYWQGIQSQIKRKLKFPANAFVPPRLRPLSLAGGPTNWLNRYEYTEQRNHIERLADTVENKISILEIAPTLMEMSMLIPHIGSSNSIQEAVEECYSNEISRLADMVKSVEVEKEELKQLEVVIGQLPALKNYPPPLDDEVESLRGDLLELGEMLAVSIDCDPKIHIDHIKRILDLPIMKEYQSERKGKLDLWVQKTEQED